MARTGLVVQLTIREGAMQAFLELVRAHGAKSLKLEPGCERFDVLRPADAPHGVILYEVYRDQAALQAHWDSDRMAAYRERSRELIVERSAHRCELLE